VSGKHCSFAEKYCRSSAEEQSIVAIGPLKDLKTDFNVVVPLNSMIERFSDSKWIKFILYFEIKFRKHCTKKRDTNHIGTRMIECLST